MISTNDVGCGAVAGVGAGAGASDDNIGDNELWTKCDESLSVLQANLLLLLLPLPSLNVSVPVHGIFFKKKLQRFL